MSNDLASLLLLVLVALIVIGALRLDLLGQLWREWLHLGEQPPGVADWRDDHAHGAYGPAGAQRLHGPGMGHAKPGYHRSGRRG